MDLPVIVAPKDRKWCGGVEGRTHVRAPGGLCEACNDYRPDWSWTAPTLATAFDDGRRYAIARLVTPVLDERDRYRDALARYGEHDGDCAASVSGAPGDRCTCGYDDAVANVSPPAAPEGGLDNDDEVQGGG